jgi:hypothetical protein
MARLGERVRASFGLPDFGALQKALDDDFGALTQRLDTMIDLQRQILAALQQEPPK